VGVLLLLGFTFFMGLMLSRLVGAVLGMQNGAQLIGLAFGGTAAVFAGMASLAGTTKRDLSSMGKWLMVGFGVMFVAAIANIFLQVPALMMAVSAIGVLVFSGFILFDLKRIMDGGETNYVTATLSVYLSIYNLFQSLLSLLGIFGGSDD
jgi:modulator of FtsH protease